MDSDTLETLVNDCLAGIAEWREYMQRDRADPYALLTRQEAAERLRCTKQYVSTLTQSGKLHCVRVGNRVLVPRQDLDAFIRGEPARVTDRRYPPTPSLFDDTPAA